MLESTHDGGVERSGGAVALDRFACAHDLSVWGVCTFSNDRPHLSHKAYTMPSIDASINAKIYSYPILKQTRATLFFADSEN